MISSQFWFIAALCKQFRGTGWLMEETNVNGDCFIGQLNALFICCEGSFHSHFVKFIMVRCSCVGERDRWGPAGYTDAPLCDRAISVDITSSRSTTHARTQGWVSPLSCLSNCCWLTRCYFFGVLILHFYNPVQSALCDPRPLTAAAAAHKYTQVHSGYTRPTCSLTSPTAGFCWCPLERHLESLPIRN